MNRTKTCDINKLSRAFETRTPCANAAAHKLNCQDDQLVIVRPLVVVSESIVDDNLS